jgi:hypothetical protein
MDELTAILAKFNDANARIWAAAALYLTLFAIERVPKVGAWLSSDGPFSWLTAKRKKLAANVMLALTPAIVLLEGGAPLGDVLLTALVASLGATGINALPKALGTKAAAKKIGPALLVLALVGMLSGCAALAGVLAKAAHYASYVTAVVDAIEQGAQRVGLPDDDAAKLAQGIEVTRRAVRALQASSTAADADQAGDVAAREKAVLEAYRELHGIAGSLGVLGDELGAGTGADDGGIPTPAELEARL